MKGLATVIQHVIDGSKEESVMPSLTPLQKIKKEISVYLEYPSLQADADPLAWWKAESGRFPNLAYLAKSTSVYVVLVYHLRGYLVLQETSRTVCETGYYPKT